MFFDDNEDGAGETAISFTDQFLDAAVAKIDKKFGKGFAKENPQLVGTYLQSSSTNLNSFMIAAMQMPQPDIGDMLSAAMAEMEDEAVAPSPGLALPKATTKPRGKKR